MAVLKFLFWSGMSLAFLWIAVDSVREGIRLHKLTRPK